MATPDHVKQAIERTGASHLRDVHIAQPTQIEHANDFDQEVIDSQHPDVLVPSRDPAAQIRLAAEMSPTPPQEVVAETPPPPQRTGLNIVSVAQPPVQIEATGLYGQAPATSLELPGQLPTAPEPANNPSISAEVAQDTAHGQIAEALPVQEVATEAMLPRQPVEVVPAPEVMVQPPVAPAEAAAVVESVAPVAAQTLAVEDKGPEDPHSATTAMNQFTKKQADKKRLLELDGAA